ncbi:ATP-dependent nuclease, partial [Ralstonia pseudosolanacearum]
MKVTAFRIQNYRSIEDTGWCPLSRDGVTVLVGQNESGKTSILDALSITFSSRTMTEDDKRAGAPFPTISMKIECPFSELEERLAKFQPGQVQEVKKYWNAKGGRAEIIFIFSDGENKEKREFDLEYVLGDDEIKGIIDRAAVRESKEFPSVPAQIDSEGQGSSTSAVVEGGDSTIPPLALPPVKPEFEILTVERLEETLWDVAPFFAVFDAKTGLLPNESEVNDLSVPVGPGAEAAANYLRVAGVNLKDVLSKDRRNRESILARANAKITQEFNSFWSQKIGGEAKLTLRCDIEYYSTSKEGKAGRPHLVFWINDGHTQLYPKQRSEGVRWFVSFFLQMKAVSGEKERQFFLMDEPGANLHPKAQRDVLRLINSLKDEVPVIYSTHSPHLIEYDKLYRIHAVQRDGASQDSPTTLIDAHRLGSASTDTLSPVLTAMGVDL